MATFDRAHTHEKGSNSKSKKIIRVYALILKEKIKVSTFEMVESNLLLFH